MLTRRHLVSAALATAALPGCAATEAVSVSGRAKRLVDAARAQGQHFVVYDGGYSTLAYPGGDPPASRGACTDVIVRAYRAIGLDLQQLVHDDMAANFSEYPHLWNLAAPDPNIDHRRVPNLSKFFKRMGASLQVSRDARDYRPGDLVTMDRPQHIAIVSDRRARGRTDRLVLIQNAGFGVREDVVAFNAWPLNGHFRYAL